MLPEHKVNTLIDVKIHPDIILYQYIVLYIHPLIYDLQARLY